MSRDRLLRYGAIGAGVAVVVAVGVAAFISLQQNPSVPTTSVTNTRPCSPQPCADVRGYQLWVSDLTVDSGVVSMKLTFRNSSASTHADPSDIQLIDSAGRPNQPIYDATGCTPWARTDFNNGAQFGPVDECFRPTTTSAPMKLHWEPDFGFFCCETEFVLTT